MRHHSYLKPCKNSPFHPLYTRTTWNWLPHLFFFAKNFPSHLLMLYLFFQVLQLQSDCVHFRPSLALPWIFSGVTFFLPVCLSVCLSACLTVCLSSCLSDCLFICLFFCLSVILSLCLSVFRLINRHNVSTCHVSKLQAVLLVIFFLRTRHLIGHRIQLFCS